MMKNTSEIFRKSDEKFIPISKIIEHIFDKMKPAGFDHFFKLYEFIFRNLFWSLQKKPKGWNVCTECNLCGYQLCHPIPIYASRKFKREVM